MKRITINNNNKQKGFSILFVILGVIALVAVIGLYMMSSSNNKGSDATRGAADKLGASTLMESAALIKFEYDMFSAQSGVSADGIIMKPQVSAPENMLDATRKYSLPDAPAQLISSNFPDQQWTFDKKFQITGIGTENGFKHVIMLGGIKDSVCKEVNKQLHATDTIPVTLDQPDISGFMSGATKSDPNSNALVSLNSGVATTWTHGCIRGTSNQEGNNVFFKVLAIN